MKRKLAISDSEHERLSRCGVYAIRNKITGDTYVGSSLNMYTRIRLNLTNRANRFLATAVEEYGLDGFEFIILKRLRSDAGKRTRILAEAKFQNELRPAYNIRIIMPNGREPHNEESLALMSAALIGKKRTIEFKENLRRLMTGNQRARGYRHTPEAKAAIADSLKKQRQEGPRNSGWHHTLEAKKAFSDARKKEWQEGVRRGGWHYTPEAKVALSDALKKQWQDGIRKGGWHYTPEAKATLYESRRKGTK